MTPNAHEGASAQICPESATLVDVLRRKAAEQPEERVFSALAAGQREPAAITYGELDRTARAIAAALQAAGIAPGDRALLFYPPGLTLVPALFGCLYAGVIAVPAPLPRGGDRQSLWLLGLLEGCRPAVALTTAAALVPCRAAVAGTGPLEEVPWLVTDAISLSSAARWREVHLEPETAAVLHYAPTPGAPIEGVTVSHGRLLGGAGWLPAIHGLGLIGGGPGLHRCRADEPLEDPSDQVADSLI
jgi:acyl-CoA synthetase (AMP-forming)/AMP-acid ligase II